MTNENTRLRRISYIPNTPERNLPQIKQVVPIENLIPGTSGGKTIPKITPERIIPVPKEVFPIESLFGSGTFGFKPPKRRNKLFSQTTNKKVRQEVMELKQRYGNRRTRPPLPSRYLDFESRMGNMFTFFSRRRR